MHKIYLRLLIFLVHNLNEEDSVTSAGAVVQFGGCCGAIKAGRDKVFVKIWEGGDGDVRKAGDQNVLILVLPDWQILGAWQKKIQHLREEVQNHWWIINRKYKQHLTQI